MPYIRRKLMAVHRVDIVWDVYKSSSLKSGTLTERGSGLRRRVTLSTTIPGNWQSFLRVNENKTELFALLAEQIALMHVDGKEVYSTQDKRILCSPIRADLSTMFSRRSWFPDPLTCGWHSESRTQTDYDSHIWHRCPSSCCVVREWIVSWIVVASIWKWKEFSLHLCPWDCGSFGP